MPSAIASSKSFEVFLLGIHEAYGIFDSARKSAEAVESYTSCSNARKCAKEHLKTFRSLHYL
ncbi:hypothetical protein BDFB_010606 [Asbolus verrucosus]|uniref:Uncharacterized protein n=1 Tax=Asbolus verrucosus TaxID=1661398 RepID=A0A482VUD3_ASBVE|nr:hypothetical protein BDFB_010606 [Asbolus verrucosus]